MNHCYFLFYTGSCISAYVILCVLSQLLSLFKCYEPTLVLPSDSIQKEKKSHCNKWTRSFSHPCSSHSRESWALGTKQLSVITWKTYCATSLKPAISSILQLERTRSPGYKMLLSHCVLLLSLNKYGLSWLASSRASSACRQFFIWIFLHSGTLFPQTSSPCVSLNCSMLVFNVFNFET